MHSGTDKKCGYCDTPLSGTMSGNTKYYACQKCGSLNLRPLPSQEDNAHFEGADAAERMDKGDLARVGFLANRLDALERATPSKRGLLFEIGCGTGRFLERARNRGWQIEGLELAPDASARARKNNPGTIIHEGDILRAEDLPSGKCTAVVGLDVIEHVVSPLEMMQICTRLLQPGGALLLHTPNAQSLRARLHGERWNMRITEYHLHLATADGLKLCGEKAGLDLFSLRTTSGTGREHGISAAAADAKNALLGKFMLGNALEAVFIRK